MIGHRLEAYQELSIDVREVLLTSEQIEQRVLELGRAISQDYAGLNPLLVGVLKGVFIFMADLYRAMTIPAAVDFIAITSYSPETRHRGMVRLVKDLDISITGRHVLFVEDVVDTGLTLNHLLRNMQAREPASLEVCALFDKTKRRIIDVPIKYKGFDLPDRFVVGYGLDHREQYRNLPCVGLLTAEALQRNGQNNQ